MRIYVYIYCTCTSVTVPRATKQIRIVIHIHTQHTHTHTHNRERERERERERLLQYCKSLAKMYCVGDVNQTGGVAFLFIVTGFACGVCGVVMVNNARFFSFLFNIQNSFKHTHTQTHIHTYESLSCCGRSRAQDQYQGARRFQAQLNCFYETKPPFLSEGKIQKKVLGQGSYTALRCLH
jgi:hypothetical protein